jgi:hypothetical protein
MVDILYDDSRTGCKPLQKLGFPAARMYSFHSLDLSQEWVVEMFELVRQIILRGDRWRILWKLSNPVDAFASVESLYAAIDWSARPVHVEV